MAPTAGGGAAAATGAARASGVDRKRSGNTADRGERTNAGWSPISGRSGDTVVTDQSAYSAAWPDETKVVKGKSDRFDSLLETEMSKAITQSGRNLADSRQSAISREIRMKTRLGRLIEHPAFNYTVTAAILLSALQMGIAAQDEEDKLEVVNEVCEYVFTVIFALEMIVKVLVDKSRYFMDVWNLVDFVIVWCSIADVTYSLTAEDSADTANSLALVRVFRLLRLLRVLRLLRRFPELMMVMEGIVASVRSLFWVMLLLLVVLFAFSILFTEIVGQSGQGFQARDDSSSALSRDSTASNFNSYMYFGNLARSMLSLIGVVFLAEWAQIARPVWEVHPFMLVILTIMVVFTTLGVLNIIVGVIVERTTNVMLQQREEAEEEFKRKQEKLIFELSHSFDDFDMDENGSVSWAEMTNAPEKTSADLAEIIKEINFPPGITLKEIFQMLDADGNGHLTKEEFVRGMFRIVHCNKFQRDCLFLMSVGRNLAQNRRLRRELSEDLHQMEQRIIGSLSSIPSSPETGAGAAVVGPTVLEEQLSEAVDADLLASMKQKMPIMPRALIGPGLDEALFEKLSSAVDGLVPALDQLASTVKYVRNLHADGSSDFAYVDGRSFRPAKEFPPLPERSEEPPLPKEHTEGSTSELGSNAIIPPPYSVHHSPSPNSRGMNGRAAARKVLI